MKAMQRAADVRSPRRADGVPLISMTEADLGRMAGAQPARRRDGAVGARRGGLRGAREGRDRGGCCGAGGAAGTAGACRPGTNRLAVLYYRPSQLPTLDQSRVCGGQAEAQLTPLL